ncbi:MAG TPA: hypothetical protein VFV47_12255 [Hyphomicrobiaceae bacterium]|nr:hypothetical protein [Hyphomicrobiaceae bacterium]
MICSSAARTGRTVEGGRVWRRAFFMLAVVVFAGTTPLGAAGGAGETRAPGGVATEHTAERQPHHAVRALGTLQERIAHGDDAAITLQTSVILDISRELKAYPLEAWSSPRNRQALIKYVLSGGDPGVLQQLLARKLFEDGEISLAQAAVAYAQGNRAVVLRHLDKVDAYDLPRSLAGHVALVKAIVIANSDLRRVIELCDEARFLSPGTLVEETALRLAIEAALTQGNRAKFEVVANRYLRRFPNSPYLISIIPRLAEAIAQARYLEDAAGTRWVQAAAEFLGSNTIVTLFTAVAEAGLRSSSMVTTLEAARIAQKHARKGSPEEAWALAYEGSSMVIGSNPAEGLARLDSAEFIGGSGSMLELIAGARAVATLIQSRPLESPVDGTKPLLGESPLLQTAQPGSPDPKELSARLAQLDRVIGELGE